MDGWVALTSVIATGSVGLGGLLVSYRSGSEQRRHEASLAHSARVWEQKSEALLAVVTIARRMIDTLDSPREVVRERFGLSLADVVWRLDELVAPIEAHASSECREAFDSLRSLLNQSKRDVGAEATIEAIRREKEDAIDAGNFEEAARLRNRERNRTKQVNEAHGLDADEVRMRARRLIETARESLRS